MNGPSRMANTLAFAHDKHIGLVGITLVDVRLEDSLADWSQGMYCRV